MTGTKGIGGDDSTGPAVAVVGCGRWGAHVVRELAALGCAVTVADPRPEARATALATAARMAVADLDALPETAGLIVATPASTHAAVAMRALERGVPVFVEKPLTCDAASAWRLAHAAPQRLFVMDKWRYHPAIEALGALSRSGALGSPVSLRTRRNGGGAGQPDVGDFWTLLPHELSILLEVRGLLPGLRSASVVETPEGVRRLDVELDDAAAIEVSVGDAYAREVRVEGSEAVAWMADPYATCVWLSRHGSVAPEARPISGEPPLRRELAAFVAHLRGDPPPRSSAAEGAAIVALSERILQEAEARA